MRGYTVDHLRVAQARMALTGKDGEPLTQRAAAEEVLGVNPVTLNRIENGKAKVSLELLDRMAALYGVTKEWLLGEPEDADDVEAAREALADSIRALHETTGRFSELMDVLDARLREAKQREQVRV